MERQYCAAGTLVVYTSSSLLNEGDAGKRGSHANMNMNSGISPPWRICKFANFAMSDPSVYPFKLVHEEWGQQQPLLSARMRICFSAVLQTVTAVPSHVCPVLFSCLPDSLRPRGLVELRSQAPARYSFVRQLYCNASPPVSEHGGRRRRRRRPSLAFFRFVYRLARSLARSCTKRGGGGGRGAERAESHGLSSGVRVSKIVFGILLALPPLARPLVLLPRARSRLSRK